MSQPDPDKSSDQTPYVARSKDADEPGRADVAGGPDSTAPSDPTSEQPTHAPTEQPFIARQASEQPLRPAPMLPAAPSTVPAHPATFAEGFGLPFRAMGFLLTHRGVKRVAVLPLLVNALLYVLILWYAIHTIYHWDVAVSWDFWWGIGGWLASAVNWVTSTMKWVIAVPTLLLMSYYTFTMVGMIVASPFNDMLSERVERQLTEPHPSDGVGWRLTTRAMLLSLGDTVVIILWQLLWTLMALPFLIIPVIGAVPLFLVTAYFTGLGFFDISMARNYLRPKHKTLGMRGRFWQLMGLGLAMEVLFLIPLAGMLVLPLGVVGGTMMYLNCDWQGLFRASPLEPPEGFLTPIKKGGER